MQKKQIENVQKTAISLEEMIKMTRENSKYNCFVYFLSSQVVFHITSDVMWNIWMRLSHGPWKSGQEQNNNLDVDQIIRKDINDFFRNYIYNWQGDKFALNLSKKNLIKMKQKTIDIFIFNKNFNDYIDNIMHGFQDQIILSFKLLIEIHEIEQLSNYSIDPLSTIFPANTIF